MEIFDKILALEKPTQGGNLRQQILELLCEVGETSGYTVIVNQDVACEWLQGSERLAAFEIQFGNPEEYYQSLKKLVLSGSKYCIFILSSKSNSLSLPQTAALLKQTFDTKGKMFLIFDIESREQFILGEEKKAVQAANPRQGQQGQNQQRSPQRFGGGKKGRPHQRHKIIKGRPGEHKEQD